MLEANINRYKIKSFLSVENFLLAFVSIAFAGNTFLYLHLKIYRSNVLKSIGIGKIDFIYGFLLLAFFFWLVYVIGKKAGASIILKKIFLTFLPMELVLFYGYIFNKIGYDKNIFNYTLRPFVGVYLIMVCFYFLFKYKNYKKIGEFFREFGSGYENDIPVEKSISSKDLNLSEKFITWFKKKGVLAFFVLFSVIVLNLGFGSYHLAEFAAVDEPLWTYDRIPKFWSNTIEGEFWKTMISDKPGITVPIISGTVMHWTNPIYYKSAKWNEDSLKNYIDIKEMNFSLRFPILLFNALMLVVFYFLIKKLLGNFIALISSILIGLSPLLLGISSIINPDSLLWTFTPLSLVAYFVYLNDRRSKYLYWAGIFLGLAVLTKYVANILYIFFFALIFLEYILHRAKYENISAGNYFKKAFADYFILIFFSLLTFFLLLPAAWVDISRVLEGTILSKAFVSIWPVFLAIIGLIIADIFIFKDKFISPAVNFLSKYRFVFILGINLAFAILIIATLVNTYLGMKFYDLEAILASPKSSKTFGGLTGLMLANFYSLIFGLTPLAFLAMFYSSLSNIFSRKVNEKKAWFTYIALFIILYYLASTVEGVSATIRYQIILYPLAMILAAIGIYQIINIGIIKKYNASWLVFLIILAGSIYSLNSIKPFYFSYASDLLPKKNVLNLKDMGDGSYEAAAYLNRLPDSSSLIIWTDKRGVCVFFDGTCRSGFSFSSSEKIDYFVVSSGRASRTTKMTAGKASEGDAVSVALNKIYSENNYAYKLEIGGRPNNFVKIISGNTVFK